MSRVSKPRDGEPIRLVTTQTGQPRYRAVVDVATDGRARRQVTSTHRTLGDARQWVEDTRSQVRAGTFERPTRDTVDGVLDSWLDARRGQVRAVTHRGYVDSAKCWRRAFGAQRAQSLTPENVRRAVAELAEAGRSPRTITAALVVLRGALGLAVSDGVLHRNVAIGVKAPRGEARERHAWSPVEARTFLAAITGTRHEALFRLSLLGLRRGEVLALTWAAIDLNEPSLSVLASRVAVTPTTTDTNGPKTARSRRVLPLGSVPAVVDSLRALRKTHMAEALAMGRPWTLDRLVAVDEAGEPLRPERYSDLWREACALADVPSLTLHEARHTAASILAESSVEPDVAAKWLGHDPALYLRTYVHVRAERVAAAGTALGAAFG